MLNEPFAYLHDHLIGLSGEDDGPEPLEEALTTGEDLGRVYQRQQRASRPGGRLALCWRWC